MDGYSAACRDIDVEFFLYPGRVYVRSPRHNACKGRSAILLGKITLGDDDASRWRCSQR
jgi:hypothetical protein